MREPLFALPHGLQMEFNHQSHCLTRHYFDPPCPQYMGNAMQAEAVLPKNDARIGCEEDDWNGVHLMGKIAVTKRFVLAVGCVLVREAVSGNAWHKGSTVLQPLSVTL